jgi:mono/diheme cytochrome c family protein
MMRAQKPQTLAIQKLALLALSAAVAGRAEAAAPSAEHGHDTFQRVCAPCHGRGAGLDGSKMLPGAAALAAKYKGSVSPYLEERSDLAADQIRFFVRGGTGAMPMFRKTEVTDAQIDDIAAYIAASAKASSPQK